MIPAATTTKRLSHQRRRRLLLLVVRVTSSTDEKEDGFLQNRMEQGTPPLAQWSQPQQQHQHEDNDNDQVVILPTTPLDGDMVTVGANRSVMEQDPIMHQVTSELRSYAYGRISKTIFRSRSRSEGFANRHGKIVGARFDLPITSCHFPEGTIRTSITQQNCTIFFQK
jgi:hypothetical protein